MKIEIKGDGSKWGVSDWYPDLEAQIVNAIASGKPFTTGWYASKKEIVSAKIDRHKDKTYTVEASCSDDFDTEGHGYVNLPANAKLEDIRNALDEAWDIADKNREANQTFAMYSIHNEGGFWVETYLVDFSGESGVQPPGDCYDTWGWQGEAILPADTMAKLEKLMRGLPLVAEADGYTAKLAE